MAGEKDTEYKLKSGRAFLCSGKHLVKLSPIVPWTSDCRLRAGHRRTGEENSECTQVVTERAL